MKKKKYSKDYLTSSYSPKPVSSRSWGTYLVLGVIVLMIASNFIFALTNREDTGSNKITYNGFTFLLQQGRWFTDISGLKYGFEYSPQDVETIKSISFQDPGFGQQTYLLFNPDEFSEGSQELVLLKQFLVSRGMTASLACIKEQGCGDLPLVTCEDSRKNIYFKQGNKSEIYNEGNCFVLEAEPGSELMVFNRFAYGLLGVIQNAT